MERTFLDAQGPEDILLLSASTSYTIAAASVARLRRLTCQDVSAADPELAGLPDDGR